MVALLYAVDCGLLGREPQVRSDTGKRDSSHDVHWLDDLHSAIIVIQYVVADATTSFPRGMPILILESGAPTSNVFFNFFGSFAYIPSRHGSLLAFR